MSELANKTAGVFLKSATDAAFEETKISDSEKVDKAIKAIKSALSAAHQVSKANFEVKPLKSAIANYCREEAIKLIHKYVYRYRNAINFSTPFTGRQVVCIPNYYADKTDDFIKADIEFLIFIVYLQFAGEYGLGLVIQKSLQKIFGFTKEIFAQKVGGQHDNKY